MQSMERVGIVCASDTELAPFLERMEKGETVERAMLEFHEGAIGKTRVVAVYSGVCKVNATIATQLLVDVFQVDAVVNAGTAGGMREDVRLFDTIVAERTAYHDVADDVLTEFHPWMPSVYFQADERLLDAAKGYGRASKYPVLFGSIVTGEQFIEGEKRNDINAEFAPLAADMETASVAHVCHVNRVPFIAVRTITDTATHNGMENYDKNCETASRISAEVVIGMLAELER
ncbi:5'-methylthioadenosine/S-adenosylhomocysteine nucleosidase [Raoultibacter timonensis]|uniref:adenosylhomocysteine nucleosidase n=2 Tax=Raoultibacter timonensis TaxID=1907662 RepID=A0ABM7WGC6_9ACTN|nr:5'-methylthioadenosine/S-adenosylhomocysteine nucleosidase [Raoultibacter timonensis]BDF49864.1 5'-methylthioadenosine/S-adenosylhomocysteine nucleosidase [Raoultibacter timonensis]